MAESDNPLSDLDIDVCNVRPAYEASLAAGVSASALAQRFGWTSELFERDGAAVPGASTYAHMHWMEQRPGFCDFVLDAVSRHTPASLGIVGLACKTASTVGEAFERHGRFQSLTNRTARYEARVVGDALVIEETRYGQPVAGSLLLSDYTLLVCLHLLRTLLGGAVAVTAIHSRRAVVPEAQRTAWATFAGTPLQTRREKAALVCSAEILRAPVASRDEELSAYFARVLDDAQPHVVNTDWMSRVRSELRRCLRDGAPTADEVARALGLGTRTLARRLSEQSTAFSELLADVRREEATRLLCNASLTQAEIAFLLGYREKASFHRAFKRWFGVTPTAYRATLQDASGHSPTPR